jgi:hypothetical protein
MRGTDSNARSGNGAAAPVSSAGAGPSHSVNSRTRPAEPPQPQMPVDNAARVRQRILAIFLPVTAVLYIGCEALDPKGTDQVVTTVAAGLKLLGIAAKHPTQLYVAGTLSLLALGALAVSYAAIATLVRGRGWVVATVAALLGGIGAFCGAILNVLVGVNLAAAATARIPPDAAARFLMTSFTSGAGQFFEYIYFLSEYTAPLVMGFALWRSRCVPRWLAVLFAVGLEIAETQSSKGPVVILFMLPWAIAMVLLAARIWQSAAEPAARSVDPVPEPVSTG